MAVTDIRHRRIYNIQVLAAVALWLAWKVLEFACFFVPNGGSIGDFLFSPSGITGTTVANGMCAALLFGAGSLVLTVAFERLRGKFAMGGGDIKLLFAIGLFLGIEGECVAVLIGCVVSVCMALLVPRLRKDIPFGVGLALGSVAVLVWALV